MSELRDQRLPVRIPRIPCTCSAGKHVSTVRHMNTCPVKLEAIDRLHLTAKNPYVQGGE